MISMDVLKIESAREAVMTGRGAVHRAELGQRRPDREVGRVTGEIVEIDGLARDERRVGRDALSERRI